MGRTVEFLPDGQRIFVSPQDLVDCWRQYAPDIPAQYALGTGSHESSLTLNEKDTEISGFISMGVYQISSDEITEAGFDPTTLDPYSLDGCTKVFAKKSSSRTSALIKVANLAEPYPVDLWSYLFLAHNQGLGAAIKSIQLHGLNWSDYKIRNTHAAWIALNQAREHDDGSPAATAAVNEAATKLKWWQSVCAYGDDVISGGPRWVDVTS